MSTNSCFLADKRHTSIRQQSDHILAFLGESIAASPTTVYGCREEARLLSLKECESKINKSEFLQLRYDGRKINGMDRCVFVIQFYCVDSSKKVDKVEGAKSHLSKTSVNSEAVFHTIIDEVCCGMLGKIYSVMSDTCRMNTVKKTRINKRLRDYLDDNFEHDIQLYIL